MVPLKKILVFYPAAFNFAHMRKSPSALLIAALALVTVTPALAENTAAKPTDVASSATDTGAEAATPTTAESKEVRVAEPFFRGIQLLMPITVYGMYRTPADIRNTDAHMRSWTAGTELAARYISDANVFYGSIDYRYTGYHFNGTGPTAPFGDVERLMAYVRYERALNEKWGVFVDASGSLSAETAANMKDGATGRLGGGARYAISPDLNFYAGAQVLTRLSDSASIYPYIGMMWRIDAHWSLNVTNGIVVSYDVFEDNSLRFDLGGTYQSTNFRLVDDPVLGKQAIDSREVPLTFSVTKEFGKFSYLRASVAGILYNKYKTRSGGNTVDEFRTDPAVAFGLEVGMRF